MMAATVSANGVFWMGRHSWLLLLPMAFCMAGAFVPLVAPALPDLPVWPYVVVLSAGAILLERWLSRRNREDR
jgi:hypothetical protein